MEFCKNRLVVAVAGGRKTTFIVEESLRQKDKKILITTYTLENLDQINSYIIDKNGYIPERITILSWYSFLLRDCIRPYQYSIIKDRSVKSIDFDSSPNIYTSKNTSQFFLNSADNIYKDKVSDFAFQANKISKGLVIKRLESIFDQIYIDEMQDLSGWDFDFIELLLNSKIEIIMVGDPRQATFSTTNSSKNKNKTGKNMWVWLKTVSKNKNCKLETQNKCFRCNQEICNFADGLFPHLPKTISKNSSITGHDGIFEVKRVDIPNYIKKYNPTVLRLDKRFDTMGFYSLNIGVSKGRTYERVLIFPTKPMLKYLNTKNVDDAGEVSKFYVALTRAKYSVAFVID